MRAIQWRKHCLWDKQNSNFIHYFLLSFLTLYNTNISLPNSNPNPLTVFKCNVLFFLKLYIMTQINPSLFREKSGIHSSFSLCFYIFDIQIKYHLNSVGDCENLRGKHPDKHYINNDDHDNFLNLWANIVFMKQFFYSVSIDNVQNILRNLIFFQFLFVWRDFSLIWFYSFFSSLQQLELKLSSKVCNIYKYQDQSFIVFILIIN